MGERLQATDLTDRGHMVGTSAEVGRRQAEENLPEPERQEHGGHLDSHQVLCHPSGDVTFHEGMKEGPGVQHRVHDSLSMPQVHI